jgi:hypothetical protein
MLWSQHTLWNFRYLFLKPKLFFFSLLVYLNFEER